MKPESKNTLASAEGRLKAQGAGRRNHRAKPSATMWWKINPEKEEKKKKKTGSSNSTVHPSHANSFQRHWMHPSTSFYLSFGRKPWHDSSFSPTPEKKVICCIINSCAAQKQEEKGQQEGQALRGGLQEERKKKKGERGPWSLPRRRAHTPREVHAHTNCTRTHTAEPQSMGHAVAADVKKPRRTQGVSRWRISSRRHQRGFCGNGGSCNWEGGR